MGAKFKRRDRVRITAGTRAGKTGLVTRAHGGRGFAGYFCISLDPPAEWDAPSVAEPARNLERIAAHA